MAVLSQSIPHYLSPKGMAWSNNSCAYDLLFTPLFVLWCNDKEGWRVRFQDIENDVALQLIDGFFQHERGEISLEDARDHVRRTISRHHRGPGFGSFTSIERVCEAVFTSSHLVRESYYLCPNNHCAHQSSTYEAFFHKGHSKFQSISEWISTTSEEISTRCATCQEQVRVEYVFRTAPPLLAFSFPDSATHIDHTVELKLVGQTHHYQLAAVIYFREMDAHFVSYVITSDGQIWFYDRMLYRSNPNMEYCGLLLRQPPQLDSCRGGQASVAIYARR